MKVAIASDHGGYELKENLKKHYEKQGLVLQDLGAFCGESCDYPDIAKIMVDKIKSGAADRGILICGTGIGISMAANRYKGIRAALVYNDYTAEMSRKHNDANIIALGGRVISPEDAARYVDIFLKTEFEGGRHLRRIEKLDL